MKWYEASHEQLLAGATKGNAETQRYLGNYFDHQGEVGKAIKWWQKSAEQNDPIALYNLAQINIRQQKFVKAYSLFKKSIKSIGESQQSELVKTFLTQFISQNLILSSFGKAIFLNRTNKKVEALANFKVAMELGDPNSAYNVALLEEENGKYPEALKALKKALDLSSNSSEPNLLRGTVHNKIGVMIMQNKIANELSKEDKIILAYSNFVVAQKYGNNNVQGNIDKLLAMLDKDAIEELKFQCKLLNLENGTYNTCYGFFHKDYYLTGESNLTAADSASLASSAATYWQSKVTRESTKSHEGDAFKKL